MMQLLWGKKGLCELTATLKENQERLLLIHGKNRRHTGRAGEQCRLVLMGPLLDVSIPQGKKVFEVNVWGMLAVTQALDQSSGGQGQGCYFELGLRGSPIMIPRCHACL
jgi:hypothetical protein